MKHIHLEEIQEFKSNWHNHCAQTLKLVLSEVPHDAPGSQETVSLISHDATQISKIPSSN